MFTSNERCGKQPDAENITFYNFGEAPFAGLAHTLGFERSYRGAPPAPRHWGPPAGYHQAWSVVDADAPFECWREGETVAEWSAAPIDLRGDLGPAAWRALREPPEAVSVPSSLRM